MNRPASEALNWLYSEREGGRGREKERGRKRGVGNLYNTQGEMQARYKDPQTGDADRALW